MAFILMGARSYFNILRETPEFELFVPSEQELEDIYIKFLTHGIFIK